MIGFVGMVATFIVGAVVGALLQIAAAYIAADGTADAEGGKNDCNSH